MYVYYPATTLHIAVTEKKLLLYHQGFSLNLKVSGISVCRHIRAKSKISLCRHMSYFVSRPAYFISWLACFITRPAYLISWYFSMPTYHGMSKVSVCRHIMARAKFQYADISWHRSKSPITIYFGSPAYQGIYQ
jgi:hypothetical protein